MNTSVNYRYRLSQLEKDTSDKSGIVELLKTYIYYLIVYIIILIVLIIWTPNWLMNQKNRKKNIKKSKKWVSLCFVWLVCCIILTVLFYWIKRKIN